METTGLQSCGRRMKAHAPPPPNHPPTPCKVNNEQSSATELGTFPDQSMINMKENLISRAVDFTVVFPDGEEQKDTVPGSKAVMDVLVDLCSRHHLNPAHHILELRSLGTQDPLNYKPNTMIGILDVDKIVLKEKVPEEKTQRPPPKIPEKTVRLVVNYLKTQKAVVRVSPEVPLHCIIPAICEKCEVNQEYLVLLRDTFTGVELELTKSLNELGIKELYAWDRKKETRNFSRTCEATEKEKKRFLGYFKTNKRNNKAEESLTTTVDGDYGSKEPLNVTAASEQHLNEVTTFPHSSVNSRSVSLGPSLSLGNISGVTGSTEIKKRRAPPPPAILSQMPGVETNADENIEDKNILSQISQSSSQNGLQKKKRRAPPPPIPTMPNRMEEIGDKRASTVGNGWHMPQKPPRGNTRCSLQLGIPSPPPYPPPDRDTMETPVLYSEADVSDSTKLVPKRNLQVSHDIYSLDNKALELSKLEETISVNSCFVSEDTTEDSGVMSSPSDILSLNSQNDSMSSRSKSVGSQQALAEMSPMLVAEACSTSDESGNIYQRNMDGIKIMEPKVEDSDTFIAEQLQDTLATLDKDLAAMEDIHENLEDGSLSCAPTPLPQITEAAPDIALPVPVTIIDEVQEVDIKIQSSKEEENYLFSMTEAKEEIPVQSIFLCRQTSENNNTGSFTEEYVDDVSPCLYEDLLPHQSLKEEVRHQTEEDQKYESDTYVPSCKKKNRKDACQEVTSPNEIDSEKLKAKVIATSCQFVQKVHEQRSKEEVRHLNKENTPEGLPSNMKTELELRQASEKNLNKEKDSSLPSLRCHRVHNGITNYEPKIGLTTFKVVPPKPEVKYFDRDASLFTGAIKIDELGNLVTSHAPGNRKVIGSETEDTLIRRARANWKSNSMGEQLEESPVGHLTKPVIITHFKPFNKISSINLDCPTSMKMTTSPLVDSSLVNTGLEKTEPPVPVTQPSLKTVRSPVISTDKTEPLFQKSQRRTSSHYLASIIAKRIDPTQFETNQERNGREEETNNEKERKAKIEPVSQKCIIVTRYGPAEIQSPKAEETGSNIFNCGQSMSNMVPLDAHSGITNNTTNIKSPDQTKSSNCSSVPFTTPLPKNNSITEKESISDSMKNVIIREMPPILNQKKEQIDQASFLRSPDVPSSSIIFTPFLKSAMEHPYNSGSSSLGSLTVNQMFSKKNEKHASAYAMNETESTVNNDSMYNIFGPKKKFKPVIQKPLPKDTSLHSALMEAIQTAGGREKLRKSTRSTESGTQKKPLFMEPENERSALLAAIRSHSGVSGLRKISSSAAGELRRFQNAETVLQNKKVSTTEQQCNQLPLPLPQLSPQLTRKIPKSFTNKITKNTEDTRQALMEAIRSGTGAARLRKVPLLV